MADDKSDIISTTHLDFNMATADGGTNYDMLFTLKGFTNVAKPDVSKSTTPGDVESQYEQYIENIRDECENQLEELKE